MNQEKLKLIVKNLELLVQSLKEELDLNDRPEYSYEQISPYVQDYDEVFYDDEE